MVSEGEGCPGGHRSRPVRARSGMDQAKRIPWVLAPRITLREL